MPATKQSIIVLVVDDQPTIRDVVSEFLAAPDVRVLKAESGAEALNILSHKAVDLVISDIQMAEIDGYRLLEMLKNTGKALPELVFMTGFSDPQRNSAIRMGAEGVIQKPFTQRELLSWLNMSLSEKLKPFFTRKLRFPVELKVAYGTSDSDLKHEGVLLNLTQSGALMGSNAWLPSVGDMISCAVDAGEGQVIALRGQVKWNKDLSDSRFKIGIGLDLSASNLANLQLLHNLVRTLVVRSTQAAK